MAMRSFLEEQHYDNPHHTGLGVVGDTAMESNNFMMGERDSPKMTQKCELK